MKTSKQRAAWSKGTGNLVPGWWQPARWAALVLLAIVSASTATSAEVWRYRVHAGDTLWDLARKYIRNDIDPGRVQSYNRISDPFRLIPGSVIEFPVTWLRYQPGQAEIVVFSGDAQVSRSGNFDDAEPARNGLQLAAGAAVRTAVAASMMLEFGDGSRLNVLGDSELHLRRLDAYGDTGMRDTRIRLARGRVSSVVRPQVGPASRYIIDTPGMMSSVRGTQFRAASDERGSLSEVTEGHVDASGGGKRVAVLAGLGTAAGPDGKPMAPVRLLPAPDLSSFPAGVARMPATLNWPAVADAAGYRLQASQYEDFRTLLQDARVASASADLVVDAEGPVFVRVRAIDRHGLEGIDAIKPLEVAMQPAPPFAISPADGGDAVAPRPRLRWTGSDQPLRYRIQLADGSGDFSTPRITLSNLSGTEARIDQDLPPGPYQWRIGATDANGKEGAWSDPMRFTLHPPGQGPGVDAKLQEGGVQVSWPKGQEGQRYHFQLSRDAQFRRIAQENTLEDNSIALPGLGIGTWYMRVAAVDDDGFAHPYGPTQVLKTGCMPCRVLAGAGIVLVLLAL